MAKTDRADVVIVGAGVIGCAIAWELAQRGQHVVVVDRERPGRGASWAAAGMLTPFSESSGHDPLLEMCDASFDLYPAYAQHLLDATSLDVQHRPNGKLHVSFGTSDATLRDLAASPSAAHFDMTWLDGDAARALEPALPATVTGALRVGRDHTVNNRLLAQALHSAASSAGVVFRHPRTVIELLTEGSRVTGVRTDRGDEFHAPNVVIAAGAWGGAIHGLPRELPLRPVRGQMFAVDTHHGEYAFVTHTLQSHGCYIVPRPDGRLLVGATIEETGFMDGPTARGISAMMCAGVELMPCIADLPIVETWSGFRPAAPDDLPVLGADPSVVGLLYAAGHYRNGILLTPITALCIADIITGTAPRVSLDAFRPDRFAQ